MPSLQEHCAETVEAMGQPYMQVHKWLDEWHSVPGYGGLAHRRKRHHMAGIMEVRRMWGEEAAEAARLHILSDLKQVGWTGTFPINEQHCQKLGLWVTR